MKKFLPFLIFLQVSSAVRAQDSTALKNHYLKVYNQGIAYNDVAAAINGLHGYLAASNSLSYKDTLSMLYFSTKSYYSALLLSEEVYKTDPSNMLAMARAAECYDQLGDPKTATTLFEQVVPKTKSPYHIYKLATSQYQLKRVAESEMSARAVIADTSSKRIGVSFTMVNGEQQAVPVNAASANLLGVIKMDAKNYAGAKTDFQQALTFFPDFAGAKQNLEICDKNLKGTSKTPVKPAGNKPK
ncbi:MAG TPA: tetratricopeptide repeat protein [Chitinophagaceae bacterium]|nr:tetratricopeptide repeat protein [Chitinophagaceae bacterium]